MQLDRLAELGNRTPRPPRPTEARALVRSQESEVGEPIFDFERDVVPYFNDIKAEMDSFRASFDWWNFSNYAERLLRLFPECRAELSLDDTAFSGIKAKMDSCRGSDWGTFSSYAERLLRLFPERQAELSLDDVDFSSIKAGMDSCRAISNWGSFSSYAERLLRLFPERQAELGLDQAAFSGLKAKMDSYRAKSNWRNFSNYAECLLRLWPECRAELGLDDTVFSGIKAEMDFYRGSDWLSFIACAECLRLLTAERLERDARGELVIIPKAKPLAKSAAPIPDLLTV